MSLNVVQKKRDQTQLSVRIKFHMAINQAAGLVCLSNAVCCIDIVYLYLYCITYIVSEMTYNVSMGTLNPTIPYHLLTYLLLF